MLKRDIHVVSNDLTNLLFFSASNHGRQSSHNKPSLYHILALSFFQISLHISHETPRRVIANGHLAFVVTAIMLQYLIYSPPSYP